MELQTFKNPTGQRFIHRIINRRYGIPPDFILNPVTEERAFSTGIELADDLLRIMRALEGEAIDLQTGQIAYGQLRESTHYDEFRQCAAVLPQFDPATLPDHNARLVFWINLYNALIIDGVIQFDVRRSVNEIPGFFWRVAYQVGAHRFSAFDIEYGILRANGSHPAIPGPQFGRGDPRRAFALSRLDPRVHFALVCAAQSCPPIGFYSYDQIDSQLDLAARSFINSGGVEIDQNNQVVLLSKIFQWYAPDFGGGPLAVGSKKPLLDFVSQFLVDDADRSFLQNSGPRVSFQNYDWRLNHIPPD